MGEYVQTDHKRLKTLIFFQVSFKVMEIAHLPQQKHVLEQRERKDFKVDLIDDKLPYI